MPTLIYADTLPGGKHWSMVMRRNTHLKLTDVEGGANVGMLFYNPANPIEQTMRPISEYRQCPAVSLNVCWHFRVSGAL